MSGAPVHKKNLDLVRYVHERSAGRLPIIGVGGIMSEEDAKEMLDAGASLVEIYSGFIFEGPGLVKRIIKYLENSLKPAVDKK
jgi:dihydroorotate dehydrogenase